MGRTNYTSPKRVDKAYTIASNTDDPRELAHALEDMTKQYDDLLQSIHRTVDNYSQLLQSHGPFHQVELGEPLSRFELILRKAYNE